MEYRKIVLSGREIVYEFERKNVKNINLTIRNDGTIYVSAHRNVKITEIERFMYSKEGFILNVLGKVNRKKENHAAIKSFEDGEVLNYLGAKYTLKVIESLDEKVNISGDNIIIYVKYTNDINRKKKLLSAWFTLEAKRVFYEVVKKVQKMYDNKIDVIPDITIKNMKTRWGSCNKTSSKISLNYNLIYTPIECIFYVVIHEYAHLIEANHSAAFWSIVAEYMPSYKVWRKKLREYE